ncbi:5259_t:CDS:10 [Funneliformis geosporum]|uniref:1935_t:CDS:1 n=1 Tax=Funneliformis geosporum TaxID=1117311 RepID=A0A9W4WZG1_9GLOM|nr:5259_t:CDS:10 [Funneliformis geosporum]CAI2183911.1 1935_t:CDS:10 [Funneliformis geosporum]
MESCPEFLKVSVFFKRTSASNWDNYDLYFSKAKRPCQASFIRDLLLIANSQDISFSLRKRAYDIVEAVKTRKRSHFLNVQETYQYNQERKRLRINNSLKVEYAINKMMTKSVAETVSVHKKSPESEDNDDREYIRIQHLYIGPNYSKVLTGIQDARQNSCPFTNMLCWGVVDFRPINVGPCPYFPRANQFFHDSEIQKFQELATNVIKEESHLNTSVKAFIEIFLLSSVFSLHELSKCKRSNGVAGVLSLICGRNQENEVMQFIIKALCISDVTAVQELCSQLNKFQKSIHCPDLNLVKQVDINDTDTQYITECLDVTYAWIHNYGGKSESERTIDVHLVAPFARAPNSLFLYGENHSEADKLDKSERSETSRSGKPCDFIFIKHNYEAGIGENSGPLCKDNHNKGMTNFVDVVKVARAQHIALKLKCVEKCGCNPLPQDIQEALNIYGLFEWATQDFPQMDNDIVNTVFLAKRFLIHRNFLNRVGRLGELAVRKATIAGETMELTPGKETVLEKFVTPKSKRELLSEKPRSQSPTPIYPMREKIGINLEQWVLENDMFSSET